MCQTSLISLLFASFFYSWRSEDPDVSGIRCLQVRLHLSGLTAPRCWSYLGQGVHDAALLSLGLPKVVEIEGTDPEVRSPINIGKTREEEDYEGDGGLHDAELQEEVSRLSIRCPGAEEEEAPQ